MSDQDKLIEALLQERDELYQELSRLRENDKGALGKAEKKNERYEAKIKVQDEEIKKLTDHLAWYRRKFWKSSSERFIPQDRYSEQNEPPKID
jgi:DNA mismatch repair ATPase MutS